LGRSGRKEEKEQGRYLARKCSFSAQSSDAHWYYNFNNERKRKMKKTMMMLGIVSLFAVGSAFAGENQAASNANEKSYNGITYFELGPVANCKDLAPVEQTTKPFNGITVFELGQAGSGARGTCAGMVPGRTMVANSFYNGITIF
jgi:hypothetical protein